MQLTIKSSAGDSFVVDAVPSDTVETVKQRLERLAGVNVGQQRLIFSGKQLQNNVSLLEYGVSGPAVLHLVLNVTVGTPWVANLVAAELVTTTPATLPATSSSMGQLEQMMSDMSVEAPVASPTSPFVVTFDVARLKRVMHNGLERFGPFAGKYCSSGYASILEQDSVTGERWVLASQPVGGPDTTQLQGSAAMSSIGERVEAPHTLRLIPPSGRWNTGTVYAVVVSDRPVANTFDRLATPIGLHNRGGVWVFRVAAPTRDSGGGGNAVDAVPNRPAAHNTESGEDGADCPSPSDTAAGAAAGILSLIHI